ncbi:MAG: DUF2953 domain-containing protein [Chloroflexota bacterium]
MWWAWVVGVLFGLIALAVICLSIPLALSYEAEWHGRRARVKLKVLWLFERVGWDLPRAVKKVGKRAPERRRERRPGKRGPSGRSVLAILRTRGLFPQVGRFFRDLIHSFEFRDFRLELRAGLDDPYDTGMLFAYAGPASVMLYQLAPGRVSIQPVFNGAAFEGASSGVLRLWPVRVVGAALKLALSPPAFRVYRVVMSHGRK